MTCLLTSAAVIYLLRYRRGQVRQSPCKAAGPSPSPRVEIARRVKKKSKGQRQSRRPVHRAPVPDEAPFPGILRPQLRPALTSCSETHTHTAVVIFSWYESPDSDSPVKAADAAAVPWTRGHHAHCFSCTMVHEGIANVIGDRIFLPSRWQPPNDAKGGQGGHAALRLTGGSHPKPQEAGKSVYLSVCLSVCPPACPPKEQRSICSGKSVRRRLAAWSKIEAQPLSYF